ncbi:MAG: hypothetical protein AB7N99_01420 [Simkaniaceae bacterium]|jgi:hypothetical protein
MASSISRALRATPQLIRLSSVSRQAVVAKAKEAFKRKMIETGEPDPRGALILEHNHPEHVQAKWQSFGYHAGPRDDWETQMQKGRVDNIGLDFYFGPRTVDGAKIAAHFGAKDGLKEGGYKEAVILDIASSQPTHRNEEFGTLYVHASDETYITGAHKISEKWLEYSQNPSLQMGLSTRVRLGVDVAVDVLLEEMDKVSADH